MSGAKHSSAGNNFIDILQVMKAVLYLISCIHSLNIKTKIHATQGGSACLDFKYFIAMCNLLLKTFGM